MATDLGTAFGRIVIDTSGASKGIGGLRASMGAFGRGAALPMVAALVGVAAGLSHVVSTAAQFDKALSAVAAVSGATSAQMGQLREQALELGASTVFSASEVAQAQGELVKAGVSVEETLGGALQGALSLAAAGELELGQAATIAANAMNLFGLQGRDVTHIADALATAANTTTADVGDFGMALSQGGSAAKAAGLSFEETTTILEALATSGIKNSDAGTSLKAALVQLLSPSNRAAKAMAAHNLVLTDAQGSFVGAAEASRRLTVATHGMNDAQRVQFLSTIAGVDGFRTLLSLIDTGPKRLEAMRRGLDREGSAAETARKRQDNLSGDLEQLSGALETAEIRAGEFAQSGLRKLAQGATAALTAVAHPGVLEAFVGQLDIGDAAASAWDGLASTFTALEPIALGLGAAVLGSVHAVSGIVDAAGSAASALSPLVSVVATGTAGLLALAGAANTFAGAVIGSQAGTALLATAVLAATGAFVGLKVAALAATLAVRLTAASGAVSAFASLATTVRSASGALALLRTSAAGSAGLSALLSPVGLAAAGVAVLAGGVALLASGFFVNRSAAQGLADSMSNLAARTREAQGAVDAMTAASDKLVDANQRVRTADLTVLAARQGVNQALAAGGRGSLAYQQAQNSLTIALTEQTRAHRDQKTAVNAAASEVVAQTRKTQAQAVAAQEARSQTREWIRILGGLGPVIGGTGVDDLTRQLRAVDHDGASANSRVQAVQGVIGALAAKVPTASAAGRDLARVMADVGKASPGDLSRFTAEVQRGMAKGLTVTQAAVAADKTVLQGVGDVQIDWSHFYGALDSGLAVAEGKAAAGAARIRAKLRTANADAHSSPSANELLEESLRRMSAIGAKGFASAVDGMGRGVAALVTIRANLASSLEAIDRREEARRNRRAAAEAAAELRRAEREKAAADKRLANAKEADRKQAAQDVSAAAGRVATARKTAADLAHETAVRAERAPAERRIAVLDDLEAQAGDLRGRMESSLADLGTKVGEALDRSLSSAVEGLDAGLRTSLDAIDGGLKRTLAAIAAGLGADLSAVEGLGAGLRAQFEGIASTLVAALAPVNEEIALLEDDVTDLDRILEAGAAKRQARDDRRRRADLAAAAATATGAAAAGTAKVTQMEGILAGARTPSERAAAQRLLDAAKVDAEALAQVARDAAQDARDFEEDLQTRALTAQRTLDTNALTAARERRDKLVTVAGEEATTMAGLATTAAQTYHDDRVREATTLTNDLRAELGRRLGNLREHLAQGTVEGAAAAAADVRAITGVMNDPAVRSALAESGQTLGLAFARGLDRTRAEVRDSATALAAIVTRLLKLSSPAAEGPLRFDFRRSGAAIGSDLAAGLRRNADAVAAEAGRLAAAAVVSLPALSSSSPSAGAAAGGVVQHNTFNVQRPVEDVRTWSERAMFEARLAGGRV